jgi:hypothetical protein
VNASLIRFEDLLRFALAHEALKGGGLAPKFTDLRTRLRADPSPHTSSAGDQNRYLMMLASSINRRHTHHSRCFVTVQRSRPRCFARFAAERSDNLAAHRATHPRRLTNPSRPNEPVDAAAIAGVQKPAQTATSEFVSWLLQLRKERTCALLNGLPTPTSPSCRSCSAISPATRLPELLTKP